MMDEKTVLVTGATAGIGKQTALALLRLGAHVVIVGRNPEKTRAVVDELKAASGNPRVDALLADLSAMRDVKRLADEYKRRFATLDVLVNNAGGMNTARELTVDGYERTFATNHLAYFLLANELLPVLEASAPARIVNVASEAHRRQQLDFDDLQAERGYFSFGVYARSKLANVLFTRELARRLRGRPVTANCLHPGFVASDFLSKGGIWTLLQPVANLFAIDEASGAKTSIYLASSPEVEGRSGGYYDKCASKEPSRAARDDAAAARLWEVSEQLVRHALERVPAGART